MATATSASKGASHHLPVIARGKLQRFATWIYPLPGMININVWTVGCEIYGRFSNCHICAICREVKANVMCNMFTAQGSPDIEGAIFMSSMEDFFLWCVWVMMDTSVMECVIYWGGRGISSLVFLLQPYPLGDLMQKIAPLGDGSHLFDFYLQWHH